jgi:hypothetical protein
MTEAAPEFPTPPEPRTDLPAPEGMSDADYQLWMEEIASMTPDVWRTADGTLYVRRMRSSRYGIDGLVEARGILTPDDPDYGEYVGDLLPFFDFAEDQAAQPEQSEEPTNA